MAVSKLQILGAVALACGFAWGGVYTFGRFGGLVANRVLPDAEERQAALSRSVDKLQSELDESTRRNAEMRSELQDLRADLEALRGSQQPPVAEEPARGPAQGIKADPTQAASRLADALKRHPPRPSRDRGELGQIYMLDLVDGGMTLVADEPAPNILSCG